MTREDIKKQFPDATDEQISALLDINGNDLTAAKKNNVEPKVLSSCRRIRRHIRNCKRPA